MKDVGGLGEGPRTTVSTLTVATCVFGGCCGFGMLPTFERSVDFPRFRQTAAVRVFDGCCAFGTSPNLPQGCCKIKQTAVCSDFMYVSLMTIAVGLGRRVLGESRCLVSPCVNRGYF